MKILSPGQIYEEFEKNQILEDKINHDLQQDCLSQEEAIVKQNGILQTRHLDIAK